MAFAPDIAFDYLHRAHLGGRLGHAYLITGSGPAPFDLAARLAGLLVNIPDRAAALAHQDVHVIEPESKSRRIVVEQVRELENSLRLRASAVGGRKVGIVREADRLQVQASNAFLKTLEEPPAQSLLLLVSAQPESLLDTIRSRCIRVLLDEDAGAAASRRSPQEAALLDLLARHARTDAAPTLAAGYLFARDFGALLAAARTRIRDEQETALDREKDRYSQTTDGSWLSEREDYYKSLTEARYTAERAALVELLARWWGDALRCQAVGAVPTDGLEGAAAMAARLPASVILRKLAAVELMRENLDRNIQEALALEVAFMQIFGTPSSS